MSGVDVPAEVDSGPGVDGAELKGETTESKFSLILRNMSMVDMRLADF